MRFQVAIKNFGQPPVNHVIYEVKQPRGIPTFLAAFPFEFVAQHFVVQIVMERGEKVAEVQYEIRRIWEALARELGPISFGALANPANILPPYDPDVWVIPAEAWVRGRLDEYFRNIQRRLSVRRAENKRKAARNRGKQHGDESE